MGPLTGYKIIELAGIGPGPMCAMLLADLGADVLRIDRINPPDRDSVDLLNRGRRSVSVDLKNPEGIETILRLVEGADALIEGFRPGVTERLGLGPDDCRARNDRLVYGRVTGWGQDGPLAQAAGHDINYIALTGALHAIGEGDRPPAPPLNLIGDFGGGAMYLAFGVVCALLEASRSGKGQVVDAAMVDGAANLMTFVYALKASGQWIDERAQNLVDGGAYFYGTYETSDGKYICIAPIEPQFHTEFLERMGIDPADIPNQMDRAQWPALRDRLTKTFKSRTRDEWCMALEGTDVCFAPVLDMNEAPNHPHNKARDAFVEEFGVVQPAPAPRFDRTPGAIQSPPPQPGEHTSGALADWGFSADDIDGLKKSGAVWDRPSE
jgi:alpha-methylacyl-CoA racemase